MRIEVEPQVNRKSLVLDNSDIKFNDEHDLFNMFLVLPVHDYGLYPTSMPSF
jgi:hypothetical protein